jgi:hypothetical protein
MFCRIILQRAVRNCVRGAIDTVDYDKAWALRFYEGAPGNFLCLGLLARPMGAGELFGPSLGNRIHLVSTIQHVKIMMKMNVCPVSDSTIGAEWCPKPANLIQELTPVGVGTRQPRTLG